MSYIECASYVSRLCPPILFYIFFNNIFRSVAANVPSATRI
jgi:hypothetical protein